MGIVATAVLTALTLTACGIPRDPEGTLERVEGGTVRAGITENHPWTDLSGGEPAGVEVDLIEAFAESLGARVEWFDGSQAELLENLEKRELDVVMGGFTVVPSTEQNLLGNVERAHQDLHEMDWRLPDVVITPTRSLEDQDGSNGEG